MAAAFLANLCGKTGDGRLPVGRYGGRVIAFYNGKPGAGNSIIQRITPLIMIALAGCLCRDGQGDIIALSG